MKPKWVTPLGKHNLSLTGFTLVELLLAILLTSVLLVMGIEVFIAASRGNPQGENLTCAFHLANERMAEIKNLANTPVTLLIGNGTNPADSFLPALTEVATQSYPTNFYLTESDYYQANYGTSGSLSGMNPSRRIDRITRIEWVDDPDGGSNQDYKKVTVRVFWQEVGKTKSVELVTYIYQTQ